MAKKEKIQLNPEELAEKKLNSKKSWARVGAVALALAITFAIFKLGAKNGPKEIEVPVEVGGTPSAQVQTTKKAETTTSAATTSAPTTSKSDDSATTTKAASSSDSGDDSPLAGISDAISGLIGGLGDLGGGSSSLPPIDGAGAADKVESVGNSLKDYFYGIADKVEQGNAKG